MVAAMLLMLAMSTPSHRAVALTFDDLPGVAIPRTPACDDRRWNEKLLQVLHAHQAPALGLVVASKACVDFETILNRWLDAGHDLGNHTFSHRDLNSIPLAEYEEDIIRGESPLRDVLARRGKTLRYFRHPLLHTGSSPEVKLSLAKFLVGRGYTVVPVTIDNQEWVFANAYARALQRRDSALAKRIVRSYLQYMESVVSFFERRSIAVFGREIPQILLLHMNALNADTLDSLLRMFEHRGYRFISVDQALGDPVYALPDNYVGKKGLSWIHRWGVGKGMPVVEEPREPEWINVVSR